MPRSLCGSAGYAIPVRAQREQLKGPVGNPAPAGEGRLRFDGPLTVESLSRIRHAIADRAVSWRLDDLIVETVQSVSGELAANIIAHAEGDGGLILTRKQGGLYCQAIDHGPGMTLPFLAGWQVPAIGDPAAARGLWTVRMLSARLQIDSSVLGTTVTAVIIFR